MPIIPAPTLTPVTSDEATPIDKALTTAGTAEDLVTVPVGKLGRSLSLVNEGPGKAYIEFDATATVSSILMLRGDSFSEANLAIATKVSFIGEAGKKPRVRGVLFSGV